MLNAKLLVLAGLAALSLQVSTFTEQAAAAEPEIVVEVDSAHDVEAYYKKIGFHDIDNHPERLQAVPRTRLVRVPKKSTDGWRENVPMRKSVFYRLALSGVLQVNEDILAQRERLLSLSLNDLSADDRAWLSEMMIRYGVAKADEPITETRLAELILRVDILPPSLVIVQGAIESAWLQSRFARTGQAIFGQWTTSESGIKALDSDARLAAFNNPRESLIAYTLNLNSHAAYAELRAARAELRRNGQTIDGHTLAGYLGSYAETGQEYVKLIRGMIRRDDLTRGDTAKLADAPQILFKTPDRN